MSPQKHGEGGEGQKEQTPRTLVRRVLREVKRGWSPLDRDHTYSEVQYGQV